MWFHELLRQLVLAVYGMAYCRWGNACRLRLDRRILELVTGLIQSGIDEFYVCRVGHRLDKSILM